MWRVLLPVVAIACSKPRSGRELDCMKLRDVVERAVQDVPTRYRDTAIHDRARAELQRIDYADASVRRVAVDEHVTYAQLERLCAPRTSDRETDCSEVRALLDPKRFDVVPDRARGTGLRDESGLAALAARAYLDEQVKRAVVLMVRDSGAAFYTPNDSGEEAAANDRRARASYDQLAQLCDLPARQ